VRSEAELDGLTHCVQDVNEKQYDCLIEQSELDDSPRVFVVYNPSVKAKPYLRLRSIKADLAVDIHTERGWEASRAEAFCY